MKAPKKIAVVGAGTMGTGIAQVAAASGLTTVVKDVGSEILDRSRQEMIRSLEKLLSRQKEKGRDVSPGQILERVQFSTSWESLADADFVVEAINENLDLKLQVFEKLDKVLPQHSVIASNTSSISITRLAAGTGRPDRVIGMHFMNPVPLMKLVEIIRGLQTSAGTYEIACEMAASLGKTAVAVNDSPGFVSNRVLMPMLNEAMFALHEGVGTAESIDTVMRLGMNHPMGPLQLADFIGLDVCLDILNVLYDNFRDPKYRACPLLVKMVAAGYLGKKSGRGFYTYEK